MVLPTLLEALEGEELGPEESEGRALLAAWDHRYEPQSRGPVLFEAWWREIATTLWRDVLGEEDRGLRLPGRDVTLRRLLHPEEWSDLGPEDPHEQVREIVSTAFRAAVARVVEGHGLPGPSWGWGRARGTHIRHLARIPAFGRLGLPTGGAGGVINATTRYGGPSWRMVVALGPEVRGWGIYPGGQSGNPGSPHYDPFVDDWLAGEMYEFLYLRSPDEASDRVVARTLLEGKP
jgi:penicillin amidase